MHDGAKNLPSKTPATLSPRIFAGIVLGATVAGVGAVVFFFNPGTHGFYPVCLFHAFTGLYCPGCGMTRALYALLHGNIRLALKDNSLFVLTLALLAVWGGRVLQRKLQGRPMNLIVPPVVLWLFLSAAGLFAVLRNLPGFAWLAP